jgi:predicted RNase H-like HicB family nuclease
MAKEAIGGYIETLMELRRDVPIEDDRFEDIASLGTHA